MLSIPPYIQASQCASPVLQFPWDEWQTKTYYWAIDDQQFRRLDALTHEASLGLALAAGEWVFQRFSTVNADPAALRFLEAAWAGMVHPAYCIYTETVDDAWRGPIRGPLAVSIAIANDGIFCRGDDPHVARRACWMYNLARHVLPTADAFESWFEACVSRLEKYHSASTDTRPAGHVGSFDDPLIFARPVPREAFDPQRPYDPTQLPALIDRFLASLQVSSNPYLRDPAQLTVVDGLPGPPYRYLP